MKALLVITVLYGHSFWSGAPQSAEVIKVELPSMEACQAAAQIYEEKRYHTAICLDISGSGKCDTGNQP